VGIFKCSEYSRSVKDATLMTPSEATKPGGGSLGKNADWFTQQNVAKFAGKWVCIVGGNLVAAADRLDEVMVAVKKLRSKEVPFVSMIPAGYVTV
jgi:hypothetical protein